MHIVDSFPLLRWIVALSWNLRFANEKNGSTGKCFDSEFWNKFHLSLVRARWPMKRFERKNFKANRCKCNNRGDVQTKQETVLGEKENGRQTNEMRKTIRRRKSWLFIELLLLYFISFVNRKAKFSNRWYEKSLFDLRNSKRNLRWNFDFALLKISVRRKVLLSSGRRNNISRR